jgi:hypothetical protein
VLHVEPASSNSSSAAHYGPPANANANVHANAVSGGSDVTTKSQAAPYEQPGGEVKVDNDALAVADNENEGEDEDLDDFFDSL